MNKKLTNVYLFFYFYLVTGVIMFLTADFGSWKTGVDDIGLIIYLLPIVVTLYYQLDLVFVFLPLLLFWDKQRKKGKINFIPILFIWLYIVLYLITINNSEILDDSDKSLLNKVYLILIVSKCILLVMVTIFSVVKRLSKQETNSL